MLASADTSFLATGHATGSDVSHRGGHPGFLTALAPNRVVLPDYAGNGMFRSLGNLTLDDHVGLTVAHLGSGTVLMLTGRAQIDFDSPRVAAHPGAQRLVVVSVEAVVELPGALPLSGTIGEPSPSSPAVRGPR